MSNTTKNSRLGRGLNSLLGGYSEDVGSNSENNNDNYNKNSVEKGKQEALRSRLSPQNSGENKKQPVEKANFHAESKPNQEKMAASSLNPPDNARVWKIAIEKIKPNKNQPRKVFNEEKLSELSNSIKEQGILQPIVARKLNDGSFEIISGERRFRASQMAGLHNVPVILRNVDDKKSLELAIIENVQRDDLNPIEEAEAYQQLAKDFFLTQEEIAKRVGKERTTVANLLRLLGLSKEVRDKVACGKLSQGHAKVLLSVTDEERQNKLASLVQKGSWSVRRLESEIKQTKDTQRNTYQEQDVSSRLAKAIGEDLQKLIGTGVEIDYSKGRGKISIKFYSDEQLTQITDKMKEAWI